MGGLNIESGIFVGETKISLNRGPRKNRLKRPPSNNYYEAVGLINGLLCVSRALSDR